MRKSFLLAAVTLLMTALCAGAAQPEFRGVWVTAWSSGFLTPAEVDETIRLAKEANLNSLIIQVRKVGDALYKSNFEPRVKLADPDFDPLAYIIEKAHKEGIEVHAWMNTFRIWMGRNAQPPGPDHVVSLHPDWLSLQPDGNKYGGEGMYLDPGIPEVQDWTYKVFMDVVKNYDIDGIHFDYVRYAGADWGYSEKAVARFNKETGRTGKPDPRDPEWCQWRRDQVTTVVRRIFKGTRAVKPTVKVTASLIPWGPCPDDFKNTAAYNRVFQDWETWAKEGYLDALIPMNYGHGDLFKGWLVGMKKWRADRHAYTGMSLRATGETSSEEVKAAREQGVDGVCGFSFNRGSRREAWVKLMKETVFKEPAPIPAMPWLK